MLPPCCRICGQRMSPSELTVGLDILRTESVVAYSCDTDNTVTILRTDDEPHLTNARRSQKSLDLRKAALAQPVRRRRA